jgi:hypothetical protein
MRYLVGFVLTLALVASPLGASAQEGEEGATLEPSAEEPPSTPAPESQAPDIETLSQRAIEHYEIHYEIPREEKMRHERRRRRGLAIGVPIAVATVVAVVVVVAVGTSLDFGAPQQP